MCHPEYSPSGPSAANPSSELACNFKARAWQFRTLNRYASDTPHQLRSTRSVTAWVLFALNLRCFTSYLMGDGGGASTGNFEYPAAGTGRKHDKTIRDS